MHAGISIGWGRMAQWVVLCAVAAGLTACVGKNGHAGADAQSGTPTPSTPNAQHANNAQAGGQQPAAVQPSKRPPLPGPLSNADDLGRVPRKQLAAREAPVALTSPDGQGLELRRYVARGVIDGPLSHCELRLTFHNPEPRRREGRFELVLPDDATVARFAMKTGGRWMEGEVVEKQRARRVYEDFLHRRQDPALLEVAAGNRFSARVFPIEAGADKEIILAFSAERKDPSASWTLPLVGLPELELLDVKIFVQGAGKETVAVRREKIQPAVDLEVRPGALDASWSALRAGKVAVVRLDASLLRPASSDDAPAGAADPFGKTIALFDTSASGALAYETRLAQLDHLARRVEEADGALHVIAFDQAAQVVHQGGAFGDDARAALRKRGPLGATDLAAALTLAGRHAEGLGGASRVVLLTDGIVTAGKQDGSRLADAARALAGKGVMRLDVVTATAARDDALLGKLVTGNLPRDGVVVHAGVEASAIDRLQRRTLAPLQLKVPGAAWIWPDRVVGLEADGSALVWAEMEDDDAPLRLIVEGGASGDIAPEVRSADERLLARAWARARIALLEREHDRGSAEIQQKLHEKIVELSLHHRVLSRWTALLVLETDADYARYGIARTDRAAILTIDESGALSLAARDESDPGNVAKGGNKDLLDALGQPREQREEMPARATGDDEDRDEARTDGAEAETGLAGESVPAGVQAVARGGASRPLFAEGLAAAAAAAPAAAQAAPKMERKPEPTPSADVPPPSAVAANEDAPAAADRAEPEPEPEPEARAQRKAKRASASALRGVPAEAEEAPRVRLGGSGTGGLGADGGGSRGMARDYPVGALAPRRMMPPRPQVELRVDVVRADGIRSSDARSSLMRRQGPLTYCFARDVRDGRGSHSRARMLVELAMDKSGRVGLWKVRSAAGFSGSVRACVESQLRRVRFYGVRDGLAKITVSLQFRRTDRPVRPSPHPIVRPTPRPRPVGHASELRELEREVKRKAALRGVMADIAGRSKSVDAVDAARQHVASHASDLLGYVALGDALRRDGKMEEAARAYGSLIDLFPGRADIRRFAGNLLEAIDADAARALALDSYGVAVRDRADHPTGWLMRAVAEARAGRLPDAIRTMDEGLRAPRRSGNFPAWERTAKELMAVMGGAATEDDSKDPDGLIEILRRHGVRPDRRAGVRLLLTWENDANDVDLHVFDGQKSHASFRRKVAAGGRIFADVTTGWGPECFVTRDSSADLRVFVHSYRQGPMGFGMGRVLSLHTDGKGKLRFGDHPFVVMQDRAYVDLGTLHPDKAHEVKAR